MSGTILVGHVLDRLREMPDQSVHCVVTSPPYYGLRDYKIEPQWWGGYRDHAHVATSEETVSAQRIRNGAPGGLHEGRSTNKMAENVTLNPKTGGFCECGAWLGHLGMEPTLDCESSRSIRTADLRDDLTDDERSYVVAELLRLGLLR